MFKAKASDRRNEGHCGEEKLPCSRVDVGWEMKQKQNPQLESLIHSAPMLERQLVVWGQKVLAPSSKGGSWPA